MLLVAAGIAIEFFAAASLSASRAVGVAQARAARKRGVSRVYQRILEFNADAGPVIAVWFGRLVGTAAIVVGLVLVIGHL